MVETETTLWSQSLGALQTRSAHSIFNDGYRHWLLKSQNERYSLRCTLPSSNDRWSLQLWRAIAYGGTVRLIKVLEKAILWTISTLWKKLKFSFFRSGIEFG